MLIIIGALFSVLICVLVSGVATMNAPVSSLSVLLDFPSVLLTLVFLFFFLFISKSGSIIGRYIKSSFKKNYVYTRTELVSLSTAVKNIIKFSLATGGFGFLIGVVAALMYLGTPEYLGPNIAVSLMTVFYSIIVSYIIFFPVKAWADNKLNAMGE